MISRKPVRIGALSVAVALGAPTVLLASTSQQRSAGPPATFESFNVCESVTGEALAKIVGGRPIDARPVNIKGFAHARCVYGVEIGGTRRAFVLWFNPANDFEGLRKAADPPVKPMTGIGDDAYLTFDKDSKRYWLTAVKRGKTTIQVSGEQVDWIQAVAKLALSKF
jgi:hypothetical protein